MKKILASADVIFGLFDEKINNFLTKNKQSIFRQFREKVRRPVDDSELELFYDSLGDDIYDMIDLDERQLDRFVSFYVSDAKMHEMVDSLIESQSFPRPFNSSLVERVASKYMKSSYRDPNDPIDSAKSYSCESCGQQNTPEYFEIENRDSHCSSCNSIHLSCFNCGYWNIGPDLHKPCSKCGAKFPE
jgi:hypothetical protein